MLGETMSASISVLASFRCRDAGPAGVGTGSKLTQWGSVRLSGSSPKSRWTIVVPLRKSPRTNTGLGSSVLPTSGASRRARSTRRCVAAIRVQSIHAAIFPMKLSAASSFNDSVSAISAACVSGVGSPASGFNRWARSQ